MNIIMLTCHDLSARSEGLNGLTLWLAPLRSFWFSKVGIVLLSDFFLSLKRGLHTFKAYTYEYVCHYCADPIIQTAASTRAWGIHQTLKASIDVVQV